jgi:hypothetical protein
LAPSPPFTGDVHRNGKRGERARVKALSLMNFSCPLRLSKEPDAGYYNLGFEKGIFEEDHYSVNGNETFVTG